MRERSFNGLTVRYEHEGPCITELHVILDRELHPHGLTRRLLNQVPIGELNRELIAEQAHESLARLSARQRAFLDI